MPGETVGSSAKPARIGEILEQCGLVSRDQLDAGLRHAREHGVRLGEALIRLGHLNEDKLTWALGVQFDLSHVDLDDGMIDWDFLARLPLDELERILLLPLVCIGETVHAVIADPTVEGKNELLQSLFPGRRVIVQLASAAEIRDVIRTAREHGMRAAGQGAARGDAMQLDGWLGEIRRGAMPGLLALPSPDEAGVAVVSFSPRAGHQPTRIPMAEIPAFVAPPALSPEGYGWGLLPIEEPAHKRAVRWVAWKTLRGSVLALEAVGGSHGPASSGNPLIVVGSPDPTAAKIRLLECLKSIGSECPPLSFEVRTDAMIEGCVQSQITRANDRLAVVVQTAGLLDGHSVLFETELPAKTGALAREPVLARVPIIVIVRAVIASGRELDAWLDLSPADGRKPFVPARRWFAASADEITPETLANLLKGDKR